ncbi:hypothetical protein GNF18_09725 [Ligilactobacillus pobuzihii]|uniref:hypothetical protein n=1 Tax=Ligilactobacillus pobuzihii TaxID=449659 RepID=UPI0019CF6D7F|nr:hypothetical protein [Ligilactobacillus pobuzihii]MBN7275418.1 hypothetical protein [Ligilactobacillus pobuzihii]
MKKNNLTIVFIEVIFYIGLLLSYTSVISVKFGYMLGFVSNFDLEKFTIGILILLIILLLSFLLEYGFVWAVWHFIFSMFLMPEIIMFQFAGTVYIQIFSLITVLVLLIIVSKIKFRFSGLPRIINEDKIMGIIAILLFLPFLILYIRYVDPKNLLLINVYDTRTLFRTVGHTFTSYLNAPLVRVLLPILIVRKLEKKQFKSFLLYLCMVLYIYLCGALKSVFIGLIALLIFYRGTYYQKCKFFLCSISAVTFIGTLLSKLTGSLFLLDVFIRRVFFVPATLNDVYNRYFSNNFTHFSQTGLPSLNHNNYDSLSMYVGEQVIGQSGYNANVGVFTEGYISAGILGILLMSFFIVLIIGFIQMCDIDPKYFGIVFVYIYYFNTAFSTTLLVTHGLLFFMVVSFLFLRKKSSSTAQLISA